MCSAFRHVLLVAFLIMSSGVEAGDLRVCADPNNLPFSKADGSGFENKIAAILAEELNAKLTYTWFAQRRGFLRNTLKRGKCDVVMGYPPNFGLLRSSLPYYRSSYVFVRRAGEPQISSFDDPALRRLKIGVQLIGDDGANTPPVLALAKRGIVANVRGFPVYGDYRTSAPLSPIMKAVADGDVDVAVVWGPTAGYFASREGVPLALSPVLLDPKLLTQPMTFDIAVGVRKSDAALATAINVAISKRHEDIARILRDYGVLLTGQQTSSGGSH
jgi:quinoprotein dehydrogenase-associated probable ABC transporter substrate-binding protein